MVYYSSGKKGKKTKVGGTIGIGPVRITSAQPSLRKQVMNVKKSVKEIQSKEELKYNDIMLSGAAVTSAGLLTLLNGLTQGDGVSNREGDSISPTSIQCRAAAVQANTSIGADVVWRHIVFWDAQPNGAAPTMGDLLDQAIITQAAYAPYKRQYQKRFKIVYDNMFKTSPNMADPANPTTQITQPLRLIQFKRSLNRVVKYRNAQNTGLVNDLATNSLYSLWVVTGGTHNVTGGWRMYFKDD